MGPAFRGWPLLWKRGETLNKYTALKTFGDHLAGDVFTADEQIGAKLIRQGLASLVDDYDNEQVQLRWRNEGLEIYNRQTGAVLLRIPPAGLTSLTIDIVGNLTGNVTGNVEGNVTGDLTGSVTCGVGDIITGNVTGDLTGTATKAERIRKVTTPKNAKAASQTIGSGANGTVTVTAATKGAAGNDLDIIVSDAGADDCAMTATITAGVITVELGKTGAVLEATKNSATLVAAAISLLSEVNAVASGTGDDPLTVAQASQDLEGGQDGTEGYEGEIVMDANTLYICVADNTINDANWLKSAVLTTF